MSKINAGESILYYTVVAEGAMWNTWQTDRLYILRGLPCPAVCGLRHMIRDGVQQDLAKENYSLVGLS